MNEPIDTRLPIKLDTTSNGEYTPISLGAVELRHQHGGAVARTGHR